MKSLILFLLVATLCVASPPRFLEVSPECNNHGVFYYNQCYCSPNWLGQTCSFYDYTGSNEVIRIRSPPPPSATFPCKNDCSGNGVCDTATGIFFLNNLIFLKKAVALAIRVQVVVIVANLIRLLPSKL